MLFQINSCVDLASSSKKLKHKDCTLILRYELEVLQKITEMIFQLECLIDQSPLERLKSATFEDYSNVAIKSVEFKTEDVLHIETQEHINVASSSSQLEKPTVVETPTFFSDVDIEVLRKTLKKFSEKIGLSSDYISSLTDVYQKTSPNSAEYYNKPSTSQLTECTNLDLEKDMVVMNDFEIPEKDTNKLSESESQESYCVVSQIVESSSSSENDVVNSDIFQSADDFNLVKTKGEAFNKIEPEKLYTVDDDCSSYVNSVNTIESSSSEECVTNEVKRCLIPLVDENSIIVGSIVDEGPLKTDNNVKSTNELVHSAIEKLNNIKFFDRQAEAVAKMQVINLPDISLKPFKCQINNNLETNDKKSKKRKNKKNKFNENEFYGKFDKSI